MAHGKDGDGIPETIEGSGSSIESTKVEDLDGDGRADRFTETSIDNERDGKPDYKVVYTCQADGSIVKETYVNGRLVKRESVGSIPIEEP